MVEMKHFAILVFCVLFLWACLVLFDFFSEKIWFDDSEMIVSFDEIDGIYGEKGRMMEMKMR